MFNKPLRIGIDIDDTITDTYKYLIPYFSKYYNIDLNHLLNLNLSYPYFSSINLETYYKFARTYYDHIQPHIPLKPDALPYLTKLKQLGCEIIFITARDYLEYKDPYELTYTYLKNNNIPFDKLIVASHEKGKTCKKENIDILIDDSLINCYDAKKHNVDTVLFTCYHNLKNTTFKRANSWEEAYNIISTKLKNN